MEISSLMHIGVQPVIEALMLHSASPVARRLAEKILTDDPYDINIQLTDDCKNRGVEILNTYLKTMGLRLRFARRKREMIEPITIHPIIINRPDLAAPIMPITLLTKKERMAKLDKLNSGVVEIVPEDDGMIDPITIMPIRLTRIEDI